MNNTDNIIGRRISNALNARGLSQTDLVKKTGITKGAISSYISGRYLPKSKATYRMAKALNVNPAYLLGYDVEMDNFYSEVEEKSNNDLISKIESLSPEDKKIISDIVDSKLVKSNKNEGDTKKEY